MLQQAASMCCNRALTTSLEGWHKPPSSDCFLHHGHMQPTRKAHKRGSHSLKDDEQ